MGIRLASSQSRRYVFSEYRRNITVAFAGLAVTASGVVAATKGVGTFGLFSFPIAIFLFAKAREATRLAKSDVVLAIVIAAGVVVCDLLVHSTELSRIVAIIVIIVFAFFCFTGAKKSDNSRL